MPQEILSQLQLPLSELIRQTLLDTVITSGTIQAIKMLRSQQEALCGPRYKQVADRKAHGPINSAATRCSRNGSPTASARFLVAC